MNPQPIIPTNISRVEPTVHFSAENVDNRDDVSVMKIVMQIPYPGAEYVIYPECARQAADIPTNNAHWEIGPLQTLTRNKSKATPATRE
ncbi:hypothetical protein BDV12DRAFT_171191 [Aspergillus spectabilis]